jgi:hypothetical protein
LVEGPAAPRWERPGPHRSPRTRAGPAPLVGGNSLAGTRQSYPYTQVRAYLASPVPICCAGATFRRRRGWLSVVGGTAGTLQVLDEDLSFTQTRQREQGPMVGQSLFKQPGRIGVIRGEYLPHLSGTGDRWTPTFGAESAPRHSVGRAGSPSPAWRPSHSSGQAPALSSLMDLCRGMASTVLTLSHARPPTPGRRIGSSLPEAARVPSRK